MLNKEETAAIQAVVETADGWWPLRDNPSMFESEIYADYRDELPEDEAIEILESENPVETFNNKMFDWYQDEWDRIQNELIDFVIEKLEESGSEEGVAFWENHEDDVRSWVYEHTTVKLPCDHYLDEDVFINIFVDTGDGNYDFSLNAVFPSYAGRKEDRIDEKASILWLARQQGFTKTKLWKALRYGDKTKTPGFLRSMRQEVVNISSHMNILTFLVKVTLRKAMELCRLVNYAHSIGDKYDASRSPYAGYIILDKNTPCGLYDPWNGGGSVFEISLEKDVRLPARFIRSAMPDGADGYSIGSVYGVRGDFWEGGDIKEIHFPNKYKKEIS